MSDRHSQLGAFLRMDHALERLFDRVTHDRKARVRARVLARPPKGVSGNEFYGDPKEGRRRWARLAIMTYLEGRTRKEDSEECIDEVFSVIGRADQAARNAIYNEIHRIMLVGVAKGWSKGFEVITTWPKKFPVVKIRKPKVTKGGGVHSTSLRRAVRELCEKRGYPDYIPSGEVWMLDIMLDAEGLKDFAKEHCIQWV